MLGDEVVCHLIGLANTQGLESLSMDDDPPPDLLWVMAGWFGTAVMAWRECEA